MRCFILAAAVAAFGLAGAARGTVVFDDFNTSLGHFTSNVYNASGTDSKNFDPSSTSVLSSNAVEGAGSDEINLIATNTAISGRLRHLSGGGSPANNTNFATTSGADGWIGFYLKTDTAGWNAQLYIEPGTLAPAASGSNGSVPKSITSDGQWHLYEWNLDDTTGGPDGWGSVSGILTGAAALGDGNHTIDSIILRTDSTSSTPATSTFDLDFLALNSNGSVANLIPEPASLPLLAFGALAALRRRTKNKSGATIS